MSKNEHEQKQTIPAESETKGPGRAIDTVISEICDLLVQRERLAVQVVLLKVKDGMVEVGNPQGIIQPERETEVKKRLASFTEILSDRAVGVIWDRILEVSRSVQETVLSNYDNVKKEVPIEYSSIESVRGEIDKIDKQLLPHFELLKAVDMKRAVRLDIVESHRGLFVDAKGEKRSDYDALWKEMNLRVPKRMVLAQEGE